MSGMNMPRLVESLGESVVADRSDHPDHPDRIRLRSSNSSLSISPLAKRSSRMTMGVLPERGCGSAVAPCPAPPSHRMARTTTATTTATNTSIMSGPNIMWLQSPPPGQPYGWYCKGWARAATGADPANERIIRRVRTCVTTSSLRIPAPARRGHPCGRRLKFRRRVPHSGRIRGARLRPRPMRALAPKAQKSCRAVVDPRSKLGDLA